MKYGFYINKRKALIKIMMKYGFYINKRKALGIPSGVFSIWLIFCELHIDYIQFDSSFSLTHTQNLFCTVKNY